MSSLIFNDVVATIGNTPLIKLNRVATGLNANIYVKAEFFNPLASVKDRIGKAMIEDGERRGLIKDGTHIIEPTSGNTGIALAFICASRGYRLTLCMPESMSLERRAMLRHLGANLVLTPADQGMKGAVAKAKELYEEESGKAAAFMPQQFD
ncbi:MAG: pyridoxal-phosphate dependent enzyme, partial [Cephaloticoccus sp.]|nr:pyridoxal-phosphate dependent enzyme [Cephaloticoccus sp.]